MRKCIFTGKEPEKIVDSGSDFGSDMIVNILKHANEKSVIYAIDISKIFICILDFKVQRTLIFIQIYTLANKCRSNKLKVDYYSFLLNGVIMIIFFFFISVTNRTIQL